MSPKKKTARGARRAPASRKTVNKAAAPKKVAPKKVAPKKVAPKKAAPKKAAPKKAAPKKAAKKAAPERSKKKPAAGKKEPAREAPSRSKSGRARKKVERAASGHRVVAVPVAIHPRFGRKFECFACGAKFYDMGKNDPVCPKCDVDQRDRPTDRPATPAVPKAKRKAPARPMAPLLDDDDDFAVSTSEDIATIEKKTRSGEGFFDDAAENVAEDTEEGD